MSGKGKDAGKVSVTGSAVSRRAVSQSGEQVAKVRSLAPGREGEAAARPDAAGPRSGMAGLGPGGRPVGATPVIPEPKTGGNPGAGMWARDGTDGTEGMEEVEDVESGEQPELFEGRVMGSDETPELFKVMDKVVSVLKSVVSQGVVGRISKEELLDQVSEVLRRYGQLKGTTYQQAVNNFLTRTCSSNFSLLLGEEELNELW